MVRALMTPLCELAAKHGTDKGGWHLQAGETCHNYTPTYYSLFSGREAKVRNVLEIGINYGVSLRMWEEFFPSARVIGLDVDPKCLINEGRIQSFVADQGSEDSLKSALAMVNFPRFDLIVDDGSHEPHHQLFSAGVLLPYLTKGGYYVIEDLQYDCDADLFARRIKGIDNYRVMTPLCGRGMGRAHCDPGCHCRGAEGERLVVISHG